MPKQAIKTTIKIPCNTDSGFPLLKIKNYDYDFDELILSDNTRDQINRIIDEFKNSDILATYNLNYKNKILLCGKPGTGKTFSVQAISSLLKIPVVHIRFDAIISSFLGETASNLRKVFEFIEKETWIVLFDEVDIIGKNRDDIHEHGEIKRIVNNYLQMLDDFEGRSLLFAATNHQNMLDSAIWRRFDAVIAYYLPNEIERKKLFESHLISIKKDVNINFDYLVEMTEGLSHSDIKMIIIDAMKTSILNSQERLSQHNIEYSVNNFNLREKLK